MNDDDTPLGEPVRVTAEDVAKAKERLVALDTEPPASLVRQAAHRYRWYPSFSKEMLELCPEMREKPRKRPRIRPGGVSR